MKLRLTIGEPKLWCLTFLSPSGHPWLWGRAGGGGLLANLRKVSQPILIRQMSGKSNLNRILEKEVSQLILSSLRYVDDQFAQYFEGESGVNRRNMVSWRSLLLMMTKIWV